LPGSAAIGAGTTVSGIILAGSTVPPGSVSITLDGVTQRAAIQSGGSVSSVFSTAGLGVAGSPYTITYAYAANGGFLGVTDTSQTLTVNPAPLTVTATNELMSYGGTVPALAYTYAGLVNGDTSATFTGGLTTTASSSSSVGGYAITQGTLSATGNDTIGTFNAGALTITMATTEGTKRGHCWLSWQVG